MIDRYAGFTYLKFDRPAERVLRITLDRPESMNSLNWEAHGELTRVWKVVDEDPDRKSTRLNSSHERLSRMPSSA